MHGMGFGASVNPKSTQFIIPSGSGLTGSVTNQSGGAGISGVVVQRYSSGGTFLESTTTDGSGNYSFASVNSDDTILNAGFHGMYCIADNGVYTVSGPTLNFLLKVPSNPFKGLTLEGSGVTNTTNLQSYWADVASRSTSLLSNGAAMSFPNAGLNGGVCLRYNIPDRSGTPTSPCSGAFEYTQAYQPRMFPSPTLSNGVIWFRFQDNYGVGFKDGRDSCATASSYKAILINFENGTLGHNSRLGFYFATNGSKTGLDQFHLFCDWPDQSGKGESGGFGSTFVTTYTNALAGQTNCWVVGITGLGTSSTAFTLYRNNVVVYARSGMTKLPGVGNLGANWATNLEIGSNINNGPDIADTRDIHAWGTYDTRPSFLAS